MEIEDLEPVRILVNTLNCEELAQGLDELVSRGIITDYEFL